MIAKNFRLPRTNRTRLHRDDERKGAPEMYAFKAPEGYQFLVEHDQRLFDEFTPIFREMGLSNAQAEKLVHQYVRANEGR